MKKIAIIAIIVLGIVSCSKKDDPTPVTKDAFEVSTQDDANFAIHFVQNDQKTFPNTGDSTTYYIYIKQFNYYDTLKLDNHDIIDTVFYFKSNVEEIEELQVSVSYRFFVIVKLLKNEYVKHSNLCNNDTRKTDILKFPVIKINND